MFRVSSPRLEPQLATPQPTAPTENIEYEIPSGMLEQLLANPYAGDGTKHTDMHLIYVDEICGLFKCHAQYATLSKRNSKVPPRIDPHIETLLQGGYHYINIT